MRVVFVADEHASVIVQPPGASLDFEAAFGVPHLLAVVATRSRAVLAVRCQHLEAVILQFVLLRVAVEAAVGQGWNALRHRFENKLPVIRFADVRRIRQDADRHTVLLNYHLDLHPSATPGIADVCTHFSRSKGAIRSHRRASSSRSHATLGMTNLSSNSPNFSTLDPKTRRLQTLPNIFGSSSLQS